MNNQQISKEDLINLYNSGKSMFEIAQILNCSVNKIVYWMKRYEIKRRSWSDATYLKLNPNGDPFKIKRTFSQEEMFLLGLGLGIYWGEGEKVSKHNIRVSNTDSGVLKMFVKFLLDVCQLEKRKLSYSIICFNDSDPEEAKKYWAGEMGISPEKFGKIVQIPPQGKGIYKKKSQYGVCTVTAGNIKLKSWVLERLYSLRNGSLKVISIEPRGI